MVLLFSASTLLRAQDETPVMDTVSYSLGVLMAQNLKGQGFDELNMDDVAAGMSAVLGEGEPEIDQKSSE